MIHIEALTSDHTATTLDSVRVYSYDKEDIAKLPKSARMSRGHTYIEFRENGSNKGKNETGAKRLKMILKSAEKNGIGVVFRQPAGVLNELNAYHWGRGMRWITEAELLSLLG